MKALNPALRHSRSAVILALLAVLLSTFFIARTYQVDNQVYDESAHIACGMEWLSHGTYNYETLHPPLARAATALLPYLAGERSQNDPLMLQEGNALLNFHGAYQRNLTLARLGVLPFFWFVCLLVFEFMTRRFGPWHGAFATVLLAFCPPVLAHASLATTDAPLMAMFTLSLLRFWSLLENPSATNAVLAGLALSLASLTKFTELPFFLLAAFLLLVYLGIRSRRFPVPLKMLALMLILVPPVIWAGYRFSFGPVLSQVSMSPSAAEKLRTASPLTRRLLTEVPVPADEFFRGIIMAKGTGSFGRRSYLMGQIYDGGRPSFFPIAILVKTPLAMLLLVAVGLGSILLVRRIRANPAIVVLLLGVACPLAVGIAGQMNIGLRHVLPVYPFLAMLGAIGAAELWQHGATSRRAALRLIAAALLVWDVASCTLAEPNFLPYFNEAAAAHADYFLVNSDLDWGQSLFQLEDKLRQQHAQSVSISYFGDPDMNMSGLPHPHALEPGEHPSGWIAVSDSNYKLAPQYFEWLRSYPYTMVGQSIRLYHLPAPPA